MIRRIPFDELAPDLREALRARVERLGYLGEFFQCTAHQPEALVSLNTLTEQLRDAVPDDVAEIVALTVAAATGNDYERHQHERLSLKLGFDDQWVRAVESLDGERLDDEQRLVQRAVLALLADHGRGAGDVVDELASHRGDELTIAVLLLTGRYLLHSMVVNALALAPPVPSPLGEGSRV